MSQAMPSETRSPARDALGDPALRRSLEEFVRRRVPVADVDDVVQTVLCDALVAPGRPSDPDELRRWLIGVARHKVIDLHRVARREPPAELPDLPTAPPPLEARGMARWAEEQAGGERSAQTTLRWMAREGEGEKLETIAQEAQVPAAQVRQRVSRMRRWMKERWAAELAAVAMLGAVALAAWWLLARRVEPPEAREIPGPAPTILPEPPAPLQRARALRADALHECERGAWRACLDGLDEARGLDPIGDEEPATRAARAGAEEALRRAPSATATAKPAPAFTGLLPSDGSTPAEKGKSTGTGTGKIAPPVKSGPFNKKPSPSESKEGFDRY
jgi:DNA-directed RNA polymerase specialized sigma24 family protein